MSLRHQLIGIDEGKQNLLFIDTLDSKSGWTLSLNEFPFARDLQCLDENRILIGFDRGFLEVEISSGRILQVCDKWKEVTAVCRLESGETVVTGWNIDGNYDVNVLTLDSENNVKHIARREGDYVRLMRRTASGSYLLSTNDRVLETDTNLNLLRTFKTDGFEHAWLAERLENGSTLISAGYGAFMARFDQNGTLIQTFGGVQQLPSNIAPFFYASFNRLKNGNILLANWQGHGPDNGHKGEQLLEFNTDGRLLGWWSAPDRISSLQGILLLQ